MGLTLSDVTDRLRRSRRYFLRHLDGLTDDQWTWKPYPECKSILETVTHLVGDDRAALQSLQTNAEPEYEAVVAQAFEEAGGDREKALQMLAQSHDALLAWIEANYHQAALDQEVCIWGDRQKLATGLQFFCSEDFYHAGQAAFIRMATDPGWDYYASIYGAPAVTE
jgi:uncharacterized damage-inducible protein DinB